MTTPAASAARFFLEKNYPDQVEDRDVEALARLIEEERKKEREECAKVAEDRAQLMRDINDPGSEIYTAAGAVERTVRLAEATYLAAAIRSGEAS